MEEKPSYYSIIPASVRYDKRLTPNAKLLYAEITSLFNMNGQCFAKNEYFANLFCVSKVSISKWISQLVEYGYISSVIIYKEGTKEILNRYLTILNDPIKENFNTPIKEKFKDNNTTNVEYNNNITYSNNITNNTKRNQKPENDTVEHNLSLSRKLGELGNVSLTDEQYKTLSERYSNIDDAIEVLDTWLGTSGSKHKNKNHFAYFKSNSWVWERVGSIQQTNNNSINIENFIKDMQEKGVSEIAIQKTLWSVYGYSYNGYKG